MGFVRKNEKSESPNQRKQIKKIALPADYLLVPKGMGSIHDLMDGSLKLESLTQGANSKELEAMVATAEPGVSCWEGKAYTGGKWYHILEGKLEVLVNDESYILRQGDSIYLESTTPHIWRNPSRGTTRALVLSSPPSPSPGAMPDELVFS